MTAHHAHDTSLLDVKLLRLFELLYHTHSVTRAAEQLGQSQPTISIWLARLRKELHDPLFVRTPEGMLPTPRAEALVRDVQEALEALRRLTTASPDFDPAIAQRHFRICMTDASHITLLPQLLAHIRTAAPFVRLEAARIDENTARRLQNGEADLAVGLIPGLEAGFYQQALFPQDWVCLVNHQHPRITDQLDMQRYAAELHIGIVSGTGYLLLERAVREQQIERRIFLELPGFLGLAAIVSSTDLIATVPRHIGETLTRGTSIRVFDCPLRIPGFTVKQHWHARYHHDAGNRWLRSVCAELFQHDKGTPPTP